MARTVSDFIWSRLNAGAVRRVYGLSWRRHRRADPALQRGEEDIEFV